MDGRMLQRRRLQAESGQRHAHAGIAIPTTDRPGAHRRSLGPKGERKRPARKR